MNNADMPAIPLPNNANNEPYKVIEPVNPKHASGLTKRESFIQSALESGMCPYNSHNFEDVAYWCISVADALLLKLENAND